MATNKRLLFGCLLAIVGGIALLCAALVAHYRWATKPPKIGTGVSEFHMGPSKAGNINYYQSYFFTAYECDINETDFLEWASARNLKEITKAKTIKRYNYNILRAENNYSDDAFYRAEREGVTKVSDGWYDEELRSNGGGYILLYDRARQRLYYETRPR